MVNLVITQLNEFFCDGCCFILAGCGNVGLCTALNGHQPPLADWAAKNACFLFPPHPPQCAAWQDRSSNWGAGYLCLSVVMWNVIRSACVCEDLCVCGGGSQVEAEAAFNKLEIHFRALVSLSFRVNNCPGFGSILQAQPQCYRMISPTCFGFTTFRLAFPRAYVCNIWL